MKRVAKRYVDPAIDKTSADYLISAEELGAKDVERRLFRQAVDDFGIQTANLEALLKPANWRSARPSVEIHAYYNQLAISSSLGTRGAAANSLPQISSAVSNMNF
ncbi:hypothetical protein [Mesorhizobium sp. M0006]|uniref:hypothetical protein n=1 Tax=Mesorhizobium sp. M0006 TaxID=2956838 RepID=UPI00333D3382